jgi:lipoate-protein ligase A
MSAPICRLLPFTVADGPHNMAADEVLLESAVASVASVRLYGWSAATLSLGYFQSEKLRHTDPLLAGLPYVRRPSGGDTLVHHHEVTYALGLPAGPPWQAPDSWLPRMHQIIVAALHEFGVAAQLYNPVGEQLFSGPLCFRHFTPGDLLLGCAKVVGSAQRRHRGALMQHGAILLARSPYTPVLPGIQELTGRTLAVEQVCAAVRREIARQTGWEVVESEWTTAERQRFEELAAKKYTQDSWNRKR